MRSPRPRRRRIGATLLSWATWGVMIFGRWPNRPRPTGPHPQMVDAPRPGFVLRGKGSPRMPPVAFVDPAAIDTSKILYDLEGIRQRNPQRFEMEQLTAIVYLDQDAHLVVGYKDVTHEEFWIR